MNVTRRSFGQLVGASALAARLNPALAAQPGNNGRKIGYCIVGLGRISMGHFMPGVKASANCRITALVSGHRDKADKVAAQYGVPQNSIYNYEDYEQIAKNPEVDAVYIALPNSMHAEYTIRAAKAGKHVLCEKPMATSVADCEAMVKACRDAGKKLMIAYRCQYEPTNLRAIQLIRDGKLGRIQAIESANGFNIQPKEWRLNGPLAGGGPLMDVGVYSLNACRYLTGEEPTHVQGYASVISQDGRFADVEENLVWTMQFPSGAVASCSTTYGASMPGFYRVHGSLGMIHVEPAFAYEGLHFESALKGEAPVSEPTIDPEPNQFRRQADYFAECVLQDREPKTSGAEGLKDMRLMDEIYASCGRKRLKS